MRLSRQKGSNLLASPLFLFQIVVVMKGAHLRAVLEVVCNSIVLTRVKKPNRRTHIICMFALALMIKWLVSRDLVLARLHPF